MRIYQVQAISAETETEVTEMCDVGCTAVEEALPVETCEASTETEPVSPVLGKISVPFLNQNEPQSVLSRELSIWTKTKCL